MLGAGSCASASNTVGNEIATSDTVPYRTAARYFVRNDVDSVPTVISSEDELERFFGTAAVMGNGGLPTAIDFSKEFVIAVALKATDYATEIVPGSLVRNGNDGLEFNCTVNVGEKQTYTIRPVSMAIVGREYPRNVEIKFSYTPSVLIAYYEPTVGSAALKAAIAEMGASIVYDYQNFNAVALRLPPNVSPQKAIGTLSEIKGVLSVQPDGKVELD